MKALTAAEMREVDRLTTERFGVAGLQLMENAGAAVAAAVTEKLARIEPRPRTVSVLCGKGNNGGDGFVAARRLKPESSLRVLVFLFAPAEDLRGDAAANFDHWKKLGGETTFLRSEDAWRAAWPEIARSDAIVDAMLGTGLRGAATGLIARAIEDLNQLSRDATLARPQFILSVDTPSGLPSDGEPAEGPVLYAHRTVTFTAAKIGQLVSPQSSCCGALTVHEIGSPKSLVEEIGKGACRTCAPEEFAALPLIRAEDGHKGTYGHALQVAGSLGKSGAAILGGLAGIRAGAGLVTVATPEPVLPLVAAAHAEYMTEPLPATPKGTVGKRSLLRGAFSRLTEGKDVLSVGPGLGTVPETQEFVRRVIRETPLPIVLDADGLNAFARKADLLPKRKSEFLAITPHPGEMARLLGTSAAAVQQDRLGIAVHAARRWNAHVILKGSRTVLASPGGQVFVNTTGNAGLAKGGTGDVLTGILAAMTAQFGTGDWLRSLALGVYLHGASADRAVAGTDLSGLLAGEVADGVPGARAALVEEIRRLA